MTGTRPFISAPGENLLSTQCPLVAASRFGEFLAVTGLDSAEVVSTNVCSITLPRYLAEWPHGQRRWAGTRPEAMWHPLMWLPKRVAGRYLIVDDQGCTTVEDDETWSVRVATECTVAGLYDEHSGTWVDVLARYDLDIHSPDTVRRVESWLAGAPDETLDRISLDPDMTHRRDPDWAISLAVDVLPSLRLVSWSVLSDSLLESVRDLAHQGSGPDRELHEAIRVIGVLADDGFKTMPDHHVDPDRFSAVADSWDGSRTDLHERIITEMDDRLSAIRQWCHPQLERLVEYGEQVLAVDAGHTQRPGHSR